MPGHIDPRRESARAFFEALERALSTDEVLCDRRCVALLLEKAQSESPAQARRRFDPETAFRRLLFEKIDDFIAGWCRRREIRTDPFNVFRYGGSERGPTQHETAVGLAKPAIDRTLDRLAERVPELADRRRQTLDDPTKAIAPAFRLQHPLPFGAAGEVKYAAKPADLERLVYRVAMYAATGGDSSRGWRYDCGLLVLYAADRVASLLGEQRHGNWSELRDRIWEAARVWVVAL